ncbi:MAG: hypothetical protein K5668_06550 [Lachnospiraceae bacterium]|nr:hypothetical protein [Lachnospiraceae bacterium]
MAYLNGNKFIFNDECPSLSAKDILSELGLPKELIEKGKVRKAFDSVQKEIKNLIHMSAAAAYFKMPDKSIPPVPTGTDVVGVIITLGPDISRRSDEYFAKGKYTKGMILNEIADYCLITYEKMIKERLIVLSERKGLVLGRLYESPDEMPVPELKYVWNAVAAGDNIGVNITRESTLKPIKSSCFILKVSYSD